MPVSVPLRVGARDRERFPDEGMGEALLALIEQVLEEREKWPAPMALAVFADRVQQVDLRPVVQAKADVHRFVSSLTRQEGVEWVALVGTLGVRFGRNKEPLQTLVVFVEWPDSRWWSALRPVPDRKLDPALSPRIRLAEEGWPKPGGLGAWWSRGRREGLRVHLKRKDPPVVH